MTGLERGFGPGELPLSTEASAAELATSLRIGRELESFAASERTEPGADFAARVMVAVAAEPAPRPAAVVGEALRRGRPLALVAGFRDAWRVAFSGGRPAAVRAQALALVLVATVGLASLGGIVAVGAGALLGRGDPSPNETPAPSPALPSPSPSASPSPSPTPSASPSPTRSPTRTPGPTATDEDETDDPETPRPTDDNSGPGGGGGGGSGPG